MFKKFKNEQLEKLLLHAVGINSILVDALINPQDECPFEPDEIADVNLDVFFIDPNRGKSEQSLKEELNLAVLCGNWKGGRKKPDLMIFKAAPGYMIALGKKPKNDEVGDCYLIHEFKGNLCYNAGEGAVVVVLSYDIETDAITLYPGGAYTRVEETKK